MSNHEARFDQAARERHADALVNVSPLVRSRLQQARLEASRAGASKRSPVWSWVGSAAVLALAMVIGVQFRQAPMSMSTSADTPLASAAATSTDRALAAVDDGDVEVAQMLAALDESPDFYLWLAANDGALSTPMERYP